LVKPQAFAASYAADRMRGLKVINGWQDNAIVV
jgi:hypothetical protein